METVCESVASDLRFMERRNSVGRDISHQALVEGTMIRVAGFRGDLRDGVGVFLALSEHFKTEGDASKFHFTRRKTRAAGRMLLDSKYILGPSCTLARERAQTLQHLQHMPSWLSSAREVQLGNQHLGYIFVKL